MNLQTLALFSCFSSDAICSRTDARKSTRPRKCAKLFCTKSNLRGETEDVLLEEQQRRPGDARRAQQHVQGGDPERDRHREADDRRAGDLSGGREDRRRVRGGGVGLQAGDIPAEEAAGAPAAASSPTGEER